MQQPCSRCGYISDRPARFCRQCGSQLAEETEASSASTRNYSPQQAAQTYADSQPAYPPVPASQPWSNQQWSNQPYDAQTPSTTPFYQAPAASPYQTPFTEQKRTNWGKWVLISLLSFMLLFMVGVGGVVYLGKKWVRQHTEYTQDSSAGNAPAPADAPAPPPVPPPPAGVTSLDSYKYPDAEIVESHKDGLNEVTRMTTDDDLDDVQEFYKEKFKNSSFNINKDGQKFVYTKLSQPLITVVVEPDEKQEGKTQITLLKADIPKFPFQR